MEHLRVAALVAAGEAACMEIDHQAVAFPAAVGWKIKVKFVGRALAIGKVGVNGAHRVIPMSFVFPTNGIRGHFYRDG